MACFELTHCTIVSIFRPPIAFTKQFEAVLEEKIKKLTANRNKDQYLSLLRLMCCDININFLDDTLLIVNEEKKES